ncbi:cytochrome c oxidase subunit 3 [Chromobacterium vaccinii]|uniref:cytochrome c oxidase subunit 3 n=1 Tax=Chromobacterium vaccinii TaxID=1108595 RepID=UPI001E5B1DBB|nr:cytochrome c oxidase subunit 3 [Chromobacterium vaccinii]MCD4482961.1 cytochrome c oxidase subunit 3 [Chromobacterium vaccinii]
MASVEEQDRYFVPTPSRWPMVGSLALFCIGLGAALAVNGMLLGKVSLALGMLILVAMLVGWFGDVIRESRLGVYLGREDMSFRWGMGWFIFSEVMFFGAFFGALFWVRTVSVPELGSLDYKILYPDFEASWPLSTGPGITQAYQAMEAWGLPSLNTMILLSSGATVTWAHWGLLQEKRSQFTLGLLLTVVLGCTFLALQMHEYGHAFSKLNLTLASGAYGMTFFMLTGFHGLHVLLGSIILFVVWLRSMRGHFDAHHHFAFEAASWYWHFVDVVWLLLFIFVYWL